MKQRQTSNIIVFSGRLHDHRWKDNVFKHKEMTKGMFCCDDIGELKEYVGSNLERDWEKKEIKITQPVMIQWHTEEFELPTHNCNTPADSGKLLMKAKER